MYRRRESRPSRLIAQVLAVLLALPVFSPAAVEEAGLRIERLQAENWQARDVRLQWLPSGESGELRVTELELPPPVGKLENLRLQCTPLRVSQVAIDCPRALIHLPAARLDLPDFEGSFSYVFSNQKLQFSIGNLPIGGTQARVAVALENDAWRVELETPALSLSNDVGTLASDKLAFSLAVRARPVAGGWTLAIDLDAPGGQAYVEPVFLDLSQAPLKVRSRGHWRSQARQLVLESLQVEQPDTLQAQAALMLDFAAERRLQSLQLQVDEAVLPGAYTRYLQPFLIGTVLDGLESQGKVAGRVAYADGRPQQLRLELDEVFLDDKKKRFALYELTGQVNWQADASLDSITQLAWKGGSAYRLDLGKTALQLRTAGGDVRLMAPVRIPLLDGALDVRQFELAGAGTPGMRVAFDGALAPLGMERLCRALGWPEFGGTLSGAIPTLEYRDGNLTVGGTLAANVFDGRVEVDRLRLEQPFGVLPKMSADMKIRNLDLEAVTRAFSFGRITGRLDGDVRDLRLLKWQPVAFSGRLYTPGDDDSRHRISQRAIENISELGGSGAAGVLSRGFLRFFEDFAYDRIALGCELRDGVCRMSGLETHSSGGYYIVKGSLVPRIDVIGFATRVSWDSLVEQLKSATKSEGPVVK